MSDDNDGDDQEIDEEQLREMMKDPKFAAYFANCRVYISVNTYRF